MRQTILRKCFSRLRSSRGESIAETLIAVLIATTALTMLAGMISASAHMITKSRTVMQEYYEKNIPLEEKGQASDGTMTMTLTGSTPGEIPTQNFDVLYFENDMIGSRPVISYRSQE